MAEIVRKAIYLTQAQAHSTSSGRPSLIFLVYLQVKYWLILRFSYLPLMFYLFYRESGAVGAVMAYLTYAVRFLFLIM